MRETQQPDAATNITDEDATVRPPSAFALKNRAITVLSRGAVPLVIVILFGVFSALMPRTFPTEANVSAMLASTAVLLTLSLALTIPLRAGDFDLTIGANMGFTAAVLGALTANHVMALGPALIVALLTGLLIGAINGVLVVGAGINAFIATLGVMTILEGLTFWVSGGAVITNLPSGLTSFWRYNILGIQSAVWISWLLAIVLLYLYEFAPIGRYLLFVGGNQEAAALSGLPVKRIRFFAFVSSGLICAVAGIMLAGTLGAVDPTAGPSYLLPPYAAAFLGTTAVIVGRFNILGTVLGLYLLTVGITGLELEGVASWIGDVFNGGVLLVAVLFAIAGGRLNARRPIRS